MISVYSPFETDFAHLGAVLRPVSCDCTEKAGGEYELTIVQPMDDHNRDAVIGDMAIIKAPCPVRENPEAELVKGVVTRVISKVIKSARLYQKADKKSRCLKSLSKNSEVAELGAEGAFVKVIAVKGGTVGYVQADQLTYSRTETETVSGDTPGIVRPVQSREQLFRVYKLERSSEARNVTVSASHISYDLAGWLVTGDYSPEDVPASAVLAQLLLRLDRPLEDFHIYCGCDDLITADYSGKNLLNCLLDPDEGIAAQCHARVIRDNYDIYILPDEERRRGASIRYGKNLLSAVLTTDSSGVITRIIPVGEKKNGDPLIAPAVDSGHAAEYPVIRTQQITYKVKVGEDKTVKTEAQALAKLHQLALDDFATGIDLPAVGIDTTFVRLELADEYRALADAYALHMYDTVPVMDPDSGIAVSVRMTGYTYDCLLDKYRDTTLGELADDEATVYGYSIKGGSVSGSKLMPGTVTGDRLKSASIGYAKIDSAAITQLQADAVDAVHINAREIAAGTVQADDFIAAIADIVSLHVRNLNADSIRTDELAAALAKFSVITAGAAEFDRETVKHLVSELLNVQEAVGGRVFISNLTADYANLLQANVGSLVVGASDGSFYRLDVDSVGNVTAVPTEVTAGERAAGKTGTGKTILETEIAASDLSATNFKAVNALINRLDAARIDVAQLTAQKAYIDHLHTADISDNESIRIAIEAGENTARYMKFDEDGLIQKVPGHVYYTRVDNDGFDVCSELEVDPIATMNAVDGIRIKRVTLGNIICKQTGSGGWVWQEQEA